MTDKKVYKTPRQRRIAFRGIIADVFNELEKNQAEFLALVYEERRAFSKCIDLADLLLQQESIQNCVSDLTLLGDSLARTKRKDLQKKIDDYIQHHQLPEDPEMATVTTLELAKNENYDAEKSAVSAIGYPNKKRRRTQAPADDKILEDAVEIDSIMFYECDSTSDGTEDDASAEDSAETTEITPDDKKFMKLAQDAAKNSEDGRTKVGAVVVDTKSGTVLGTGWNRMPKNCDNKFNWGREGPIEETKHLYVVYGDRAAIFDAYQKKHDLVGATIYTTLYPSNVCAQCIRDAGISEVVYVSDKFHDMVFMKASRRILSEIKCRLYNDKD